MDSEESALKTQKKEHEEEKPQSEVKIEVLHSDEIAQDKEMLPSREAQTSQPFKVSKESAKDEQHPKKDDLATIISPDSSISAAEEDRKQIVDASKSLAFEALERAQSEEPKQQMVSTEPQNILESAADIFQNVPESPTKQPSSPVRPKKHLNPSISTSKLPFPPMPPEREFLRENGIIKDVAEGLLEPTKKLSFAPLVLDDAEEFLKTKKLDEKSFSVDSAAIKSEDYGTAIKSEDEGTTFKSEDVGEAIRVKCGGAAEKPRANTVKDENGFQYYRCRFCGLTFNYMTTLKAHERVHNIDLPYTCNKCGEAFHFMCELEYHAKSHLDQKGYKCECGRTFYQYTDLLYHKHPGEDDEGPFEGVPPPQPPPPPKLQPSFSMADFPVPEFAVEGSEPKHPLRQWSSVRSRPYICQYCSKSYPDSRQLAYHMYSHRGERIFNPRASRYLMCRNDNSYISPGADF